MTPEQRERKRAIYRAWYARHATKKRALSAAYRAAHPEQAPVYYAKNREHILVRNRARRLATREIVNAKKRAYWDKTKDVTNAKNRAKWADDPETARLKQRTYHQKNAAYIQERTRKRRTDNLELFHERERLYRAKHPDILLARNRRRRALRKGAPINDLSEAQWQEIQDAQNGRCVYCPQTCKLCHRKAHKLQPDHVTPYAHNGSNTLWNVVAVCGRCNSRKGSRKVLKPVQPLLLTVAPARKPKA